MSVCKTLRLARAVMLSSGVLAGSAMPAAALFAQPYSSAAGAGQIMVWNHAGMLMERECLAIALYHEARGEPRSGQVAVSATILNRVRSTAYPNSVCAVVYQNAHRRNACQFSFACDVLADRPKKARLFSKMRRLAGMALAGTLWREEAIIDPQRARKLAHMTHYHRHDVMPAWSPKLERLTRIGDHLFLRSNRVTSRYN